MNSIFSSFNDVELRDICRHHIDTFESWSRRLIDETLKKNYGADYFEHKLSNDQPLVKNEIKQRIDQRMQGSPGRFPRKIDAIVIEDIEYFLCRNDLYSNHYRQVLEPFYSGQDEVRSVLKRLTLIRNKLSHGNTISLHEAEQCICYSNDFISVFKQHYIELGKEEEYNVPVFLRLRDCLGNDIIREDTNYDWELHCYGHLAPYIRLRSGDEYRLWVEVDSSFEPSFYEIQWSVTHSFSQLIAKGTGAEIRFSVSNKHVSYMPEIYIVLTTKRDWHRFREVDDRIKMNLDKVLPPIEDAY